MRLHSQERGLIGGNPQLYWKGKPIQGVVPILQMLPKEDLSVEVEVCLLIGPNTARWFHHTVQKEHDIPHLLLEYWNDPEEVLMKYFGWAFDPTVKASRTGDAGKEVLTLKDLGL